MSHSNAIRNYLCPDTTFTAAAAVVVVVVLVVVVVFFLLSFFLHARACLLYLTA